MTRAPLLFLVDILECCELLTSYTKNVKESTFTKDNQLQDAVFRRIEIIGEASKNVTPKIQKKYSTIPWSKMIGMRNILIHRYHGIDLSEAWSVIKSDVPKLKKQIQKILEDEGLI